MFLYDEFRLYFALCFFFFEQNRFRMFLLLSSFRVLYSEIIYAKNEGLCLYILIFYAISRKKHLIFIQKGLTKRIFGYKMG